MEHNENKKLRPDQPHNETIKLFFDNIEHHRCCQIALLKDSFESFLNRKNTTPKPRKYSIAVKRAL